MKKVMIALAIMIYSTVSYSSDEICYTPINKIQNIMKLSFPGEYSNVTAWQAYIDAVNIGTYFVANKKQDPKASNESVMRLAKDIGMRQSTTFESGFYARELMSHSYVANDIINIVETDNIRTCMDIATYVFFGKLPRHYETESAPVTPAEPAKESSLADKLDAKAR